MSSDTEYYLYKYMLQQNGKERATLSNSTFPEDATQSAIICLKLTIETLEQGVKYVQS